MAKVITTNDFIQRAKKIHGDLFIYGQLPRVRDPRLVPDTLAMLSTHSAD